MPLQIRFHGHSAFQITSERKVKILIDPYISKNPSCATKVEDIEKMDLILVTHGAFDHLGDAVEITKNTGGTLVCAPEVKVHALRKGVPDKKIQRIGWGLTIEVSGIKIRAVECRHLSFFESEPGIYLSGMPLSFIIETESGVRIYHAGDTSIFSDMKLIGELYRPQIGCLPLPPLSPFEALLAAQWLGLETAIPMHYDGMHAQWNALYSKEPLLFAEYVKSVAPSIKVEIMKPGQVLEFKTES